MQVTCHITNVANKNEWHEYCFEQAVIRDICTIRVIRDNEFSALF